VHPGVPAGSWARRGVQVPGGNAAAARGETRPWQRRKHLRHPPALGAEVVAGHLPGCHRVPGVTAPRCHWIV